MKVHRLNENPVLLHNFSDARGVYFFGILLIRHLAEKGDFAFHFTYLNYHPRIQSMIYTTNWIERLQKDFRRVTRMCGALPSEESVLLLMGKTAMDKDAYDRALPWMELDKTLFPGE